MRRRGHLRDLCHAIPGATAAVIADGTTAEIYVHYATSGLKRPQAAIRLGVDVVVRLNRLHRRLGDQNLERAQLDCQQFRMAGVRLTGGTWAVVLTDRAGQAGFTGTVLDARRAELIGMLADEP